MVGDDVPYILLHLDHQSDRLKISVTGTDGTRYHQFVDDIGEGRNTSATGFFAIPFTGDTFRMGGPQDGPPKLFTVPDGDYKIDIEVLKALGDKSNPAHYERWVSAVFTIDRP
jgi:minor extracellular serine protease Vpr